MAPLFGLRMLWLPEMRMRQLWMITLRQPQMGQMGSYEATIQNPPGKESNPPGTGWMGCVFLFCTH